MLSDCDRFGDASLAKLFFECLLTWEFSFYHQSREWSGQLYVFMIESICISCLEEEVLDELPPLDLFLNGLDLPSLQKKP